MIAVKHDVTLNFLYLKMGFFMRVFHSPSFDCHCTLNQIVENKLTFFVGFFGCLASLKHNFLKYNRSCFNSTLYFSFTQCRFMLEKRDFQLHYKNTKTLASNSTSLYKIAETMKCENKRTSKRRRKKIGKRKNWLEKKIAKANWKKKNLREKCSRKKFPERKKETCFQG